MIVVLFHSNAFSLSVSLLYNATMPIHRTRRHPAIWSLFHVRPAILDPAVNNTAKLVCMPRALCLSARSLRILIKARGEVSYKYIKRHSNNLYRTITLLQLTKLPNNVLLSCDYIIEFRLHNFNMEPYIFLDARLLYYVYVYWYLIKNTI